MKVKGLKAARRLISKVLAKPGIGSGQRDQLRRAKRELDKVAQSGTLDRARMFRVTESISRVLLDILEANDAER